MAEYKFNPVKLAQKVLKSRKILYINFHFFIYKKSGVFELLDDLEMSKIILELLGDNYRKRWGEETKHCIAIKCFHKPEDINADKNLMNMKNGMLCLKSMKLFPHAPKYMSTIQLSINYNQESVCPKWEKALDEIFLGKQWKINLLQEFFGYCLTADTSHQVALMNVGDGANGKSLIFNEVFYKILGKDNISAVPISQLGNRYYLAQMFGKLVNLSLESETKQEINDANFKAIVTGDVLTVDEKYEKPFNFNPFCKLIFAMNKLPYISDKTEATYRRILVISYDKIFEKKEQNKNLKNELLEELDGIFLWMLKGLKQLNKQGHFSENVEMDKLLEEYKRDNNPTIVFIDDNIKYEENNTITKKKIYEKYCVWVKDNGHKRISDKMFNREIKKQFRGKFKEGKSGGDRLWKNLRLVLNDYEGQIFNSKLNWEE